jgi:cation diffusion facilitator CzcD-associated flavoprotein CzcO
MQQVDVVIVGAGLSGIGAARQLLEKCPGKRFVLLEGRDRVGGTWDIFRYPGIRSDSDMYTMGYDSKPWREAKAIADGASILAYVREAASESGIDQHIRFGHRVTAAAWSTATSTWTVTATLAGGETVQLGCNMLLMCSGYYSYRGGYTPDFVGREDFTGPIVHPQAWPENLDYRDQRVVIIGSGATAMTLVPALARTAAKVTMLQRSPTYVVSLPSEDAVANWLKKLLPARLAYRLTRWKNVQFQRYVYRQTRQAPDKVRRQLLGMVRKELGPDYDVDRHFTPSYQPWDQRLCLVPDADLFAAIRSGRAEVVTDTIERFTAQGIRLNSGATLPADIIVTATGLQVVLMGEVAFSLDGQPISFPQTYSYRGMMFSGVPNLLYTLGYINASWTLRSELVAEFACRIIHQLDALGVGQCTPRLRASDVDMPAKPMIDDFTPGYLQRTLALFPRQGDRAPWRNTQNYVEDREHFRNAPLADGVLSFDHPRAGALDRTPG